MTPRRCQCGCGWWAARVEAHHINHGSARSTRATRSGVDWVYEMPEHPPKMRRVLALREAIAASGGVDLQWQVTLRVRAKLTATSLEGIAQKTCTAALSEQNGGGRWWDPDIESGGVDSGMCSKGMGWSRRLG
ncbi:hypothetical protein C8R45DRAFT_943430 [Mycena sanguinolenta]|nr:hypothetical protein C8R45DRAFT_943430 [Mycena sanguinolenta]